MEFCISCPAGYQPGKCILQQKTPVDSGRRLWRANTSGNGVTFLEVVTTFCSIFFTTILLFILAKVGDRLVDSSDDVAESLEGLLGGFYLLPQRLLRFLLIKLLNLVAPNRSFLIA